MDNTNTGCCNMILWDMFMVFILITFGGFLPDSLHMVFKLTIGILSAVLFFVLMHIPILGIFIQLLCCGFWYELFSGLLPIEKWTAGDTAALWFCRILLIVLILLLHTGSFLIMREEAGMSDKWNLNIFLDFKKPHRNTTNAENQSYSYKQEQTYYHEPNTHSTYNQENTSDKANNKNNYRKNTNTAGNGSYQKTSSSNTNNKDSYEKYTNTAGNSSNTNSQANVFQPFSGCNDVDSLKRRYRQLVRTYHPDENGGDTEAFTLLQKEYERLLNLFQKQ